MIPSWNVSRDTAPRRHVLAAGLLLAGIALGARAQAADKSADVDELPRIVITDPNRDLFRLGLPSAVGDADLAGQATEIERRDLDLVGLFNLLKPESFPDALNKEGLAFSADSWATVGAQGVGKLRATRASGGIVVEGRLYQVGRGDAPLLTKTYHGSELRPLVHAWANDVIAQFTGTPGVFGSRIAFAMTGRSAEVATLGMDGQEMQVVTQMKSPCLLPAFSPTGGQIAFNSFLRGGADLWVVSASGGRAHRISSKSGLNTGPAWFPGGSTLIATLSFEGNAELYKLSASDGKVLARLTNTPAIDSSASVSPGGDQIAFVSDRQGTPQIFLMPSSGGSARRLTFQGNYNQTPVWSPRGDTIAFTARDERKVFDVFQVSPDSGVISRVTQDQGRTNEEPSYAPNGRLLVFRTDRSGFAQLVVSDLKGDRQTVISGAKGADLMAPTWGPIAQ